LTYKEGYIMKAVVYHGPGDIRIDQVDEPQIQQRQDAIIRVTASAICGTDLHLIRNSVAGMQPGTILGHEAVGTVEEVGPEVRNFRHGDRVVIPSTIACGNCSYCRAGFYSQCDHANPQGPRAGTAFFGGPADTGPFQGLQAQYARIPYANVGMVRVPDEVSDDQAITISDIFPTAYFGADLADIKPGRTVVVFGCGPVGQLVIASAKLMGAGRILAVDTVPSRLEMAKAQNAEVINFNEGDPVHMILRLTGGIGADRVIDAVGVDAEAPREGPAAKQWEKYREEDERQLKLNTQGKAHPQADNWVPGNAPGMALRWAVQCIAKAGTLAVIGVYPETQKIFPFGEALGKNLTIRGGNCNHRKYIPKLLDLVQNGTIDPMDVLTQMEPLSNAIEAYKAFDTRSPGWVKVELEPTVQQAR
jgi:threonine dehydrogenase-like Zn-dependent dehydrogenase